MFRRSGGYVCLMTLLLQLENALCAASSATTPLSEEKEALLVHIKLVFRILTLSMRFEPSNARYFLYEVRFDGAD